MLIGLYHGYELTGSGSNEYTRYLANTLSALGHQVHIICREPEPGRISFLSDAYAWSTDGRITTLFHRTNRDAVCVLHQLPHGRVRPVYVTDKQRDGNVKPFVSLSEDELREYHELNEYLLKLILLKIRPDILHANHLVYQPVDALEACRATGIPLVIYPHGSSIEYVLRVDDRYKSLALDAIHGCSGLICGNREVRDRILAIYPESRDEILAKTQIVGVGVDTSLFRPIGKSGREKNILALIATGVKGGKSPELTKSLYGRLQNGEIESTRDYWDAYNHSQPDEDLKEHLQQIPWSERILVFVGALTSGKGLQSLIIALPLILARHPDTHVIIVGSGAYREVLEGLTYALITSNKSLLLGLCRKGMDLDRNELTGPWEDVQQYLGHSSNLSDVLLHGGLLDGHIHFIGRLDHSRLQYLFPCADIAVFPSIVPEAYPLVLMESLSNGVIPVVTYFSGFKDGVDELEPLLGKSLTGKMKIINDPVRRIDSIISNISGLLDEPDLKIYTSEMRRIAVENYDWKMRADQLVQAYSSIVQAKG